MENFPQLKSDRLVLRQFTDEDLEHVYQGLTHPEVIKYYGVSYGSLEETKEQMKWFADLEKSGSGIWWAITSAGDNIFFGATGLNNLTQEHRKAELGFWLLPEFQKKGIIRESVPLVLKYAFEVLNLHRIEALVETENTNSAKALKNLNFQHEGRMRDYEVKNGRSISVDIFSCLKGE